jgi:hypothetical protein
MAGIHQIQKGFPNRAREWRNCESDEFQNRHDSFEIPDWVRDPMAMEENRKRLF